MYEIFLFPYRDLNPFSIDQCAVNYTTLALCLLDHCQFIIIDNELSIVDVCTDSVRIQTNIRDWVAYRLHCYRSTTCKCSTDLNQIVFYHRKTWIWLCSPRKVDIMALRISTISGITRSSAWPLRFLSVNTALTFFAFFYTLSRVYQHVTKK